MKCIAVDDEPLALAQIESYIKRVPTLELVAACNDAVEAVEIMRQEDIDLLFLDINMPDINGMDLAKSLSGYKTAIVFTTAYSEYAVEGFKVDAMGYLLKPFSFDEFADTVTRVQQRLKVVTATVDNQPDDHIFVKQDQGMVKLSLSDIVMVKGLSEYIQIFSEKIQRPITTLMSMKRMEELLPASGFMRIHRSYIINLDKISAVKYGKVILENGTEIPIGDSYKPSFQDYLNSKLLK